jgi:hypothetical protein
LIFPGVGEVVDVVEREAQDPQLAAEAHREARLRLLRGDRYGERGQQRPNQNRQRERRHGPPLLKA